MIRIKSDPEVMKMRDAGRIVGRALAELSSAAEAGVSTAELDRITEDMILGAGGVPAFKGYRGYPASICASVNEEIVHGIPSERKLAEGDILSVDVGVELNGYFADAAVTVAIGRVAKEAKRLMKVCREALDVAVKMLVPGQRLQEVCRSVQETVENGGFSVIRDYVGHGIGQNMHEDPQVPNFVSERGREAEIVLKRGMVLAIEPMICVGKAAVKVLDDGWTAVTQDGSLAAHYEHTIAVREDSGWILTGQ